jgi:hypothetical protein
LREADLPVFTPSRGLHVEYGDAIGGFEATLGTVDLPGVGDIGAYLDRVPGDGGFSFYVCLHVTGLDRVRDLAGRLARHVGAPIEIDADGFRQTDDGWRYARRLPARRYGRPLLETGWDGAGKNVGMYVARWEPDADLTGAVDIAVEFLSESLSALDGWRFRKAGEVDAFRNAKGVVVSTKAVRSKAQAAEAKRRAGYRCQTCGVKPEDVYGRHGRACLEAHHIEPLAVTKKAFTTMKDLVCVCASCHRVLGLLPHGRRGLAALREQFGYDARVHA